MKHYSTYQSQFIEIFGKAYPQEAWEDCLTITNGKKYPDEYLEIGTYPICGSGGIMGYGDHKLCSKDTIILGRKGNINSPIYMETDYWIVDTAFSLDVDCKKLHPKYFYYWCVLFDFTKYNKQGVLPSLTKNDLLKIEISIPPMNEQIKFVQILDQADKSKFSSLKSQFIEMFEEDRFSKYRLGNIVSIRTGKLDANASSENGEYPFFTCGVDTLKIDKYAFDCEAVLLAGNGDFCVKYYNGKFNAYQRTYVIETLDSTALSVPYLYAWLRQYANELREKAIGGIIKYIKMGDLTEALIPLPSLEEQNRYEAIAQQADKSKLIQNNTLLNNKLKFCYCYTPRHISS